jgi:drug/metabolite transporter (DMT)-like permease
VIAIVGGLGAATVFAAATLSASRGARMIGAQPFLAGVMLVGLVVTLPAVAAEGVPHIGGADAVWLVLSGAGNVAGLLCAYAALRLGKVGIVAPIVSTEGAIAAVIAVLAGEGLSGGAGATLGLIACGILLSGVSRETEQDLTTDPRGLRALGLAVAAAFAFGASLYATARVGASLSIAWAVLPARVIGVLAVTLPLVVSGTLTITRRALPFVVLSGLCEVAGFALFTVGSRHGIAVSAVLASQFAAIAAVAAYFLFGERLARIQIAGVTAIVVGVGVLSVLQA